MTPSTKKRRLFDEAAALDKAADAHEQAGRKQMAARCRREASEKRKEAMRQ